MPWGAPAPPATPSGPRSPSPALALPPAPSMPVDVSGRIPAGVHLPRRVPPRHSRPPTPAVSGISVHSHHLPPTPSPSLLIPWLCHAMPYRATTCPHCLFELPPAQTAPHPKPVSVTDRTIWGSSLCHRGSRISLLAVGAPTLPRHSRDAAQGASQPGTWKVPPPHLGTAAPGCCPQGGQEGTGPSHCSRAGWGPGPGRMTRTHPCPGVLPSQCHGHSLSTIPPPGDRPPDG